MGDETKFKLLVEQKIDHYCGEHRGCEKPEQCGKFKHIIDVDAKKAFVVSDFYFQFITIFLECLVFLCRDLQALQDVGHHEHCGGSTCC